MQHGVQEWLGSSSALMFVLVIAVGIITLFGFYVISCGRLGPSDPM
jgi:hypothetical protein